MFTCVSIILKLLCTNINVLICNLNNVIYMYFIITCKPINSTTCNSQTYHILNNSSCTKVIYMYMYTQCMCIMKCRWNNSYTHEQCVHILHKHSQVQNLPVDHLNLTFSLPLYTSILHSLHTVSNSWNVKSTHFIQL